MNYGGYGKGGWSVYYNDAGNMYLRFGTNDGWGSFIAWDDVFLDEWALYTITLDGTSYAIYVNGERVATGTISGYVESESDVILRIGESVNAGERFKGSLDNIMLFSRALSRTEVKTLYYGKKQLNDAYVLQKDVYVDSDGKVGIGTTSPDQKLEVAGNIKMSADNNKLLFGAGEDASIYYDGNDMLFNQELNGS